MLASRVDSTAVKWLKLGNVTMLGYGFQYSPKAIKLTRLRLWIIRRWYDEFSVMMYTWMFAASLSPNYV